jgi:hypothetical protein
VAVTTHPHLTPRLKKGEKIHLYLPPPRRPGVTRLNFIFFFFIKYGVQPKSFFALSKCPKVVKMAIFKQRN